MSPAYHPKSNGKTKVLIEFLRHIFVVFVLNNLKDGLLSIGIILLIKELQSVHLLKL